MARKRRRRSFGSSTWQMTERLFARQGRSPRRLQVCKVEAKALKAITNRLARTRSGAGTVGSGALVAVWEDLNQGRCRKARKKLVRIVNAHPRIFQTYIDRAQRAGYVRVPGRNLMQIVSER
jgi:hypothetical protein